ncbi:MAG: class I SAM-dependent methyltransferase [Candidatus Kerfeldbacteria bacterium]|nr:class I SAM-dependent methyltransferase [Candidatus Kerfeldbacteria bacterium]
MVADLVFYTVAVAIIAVFLTAAVAGAKAAPFVPTWQRDVRRMLNLAQVKPGERVVDLGSGDGRFLITAVREFGAIGDGYELSLLPYLISRWRIIHPSLNQRIKIHYRDFYRSSLSAVDVVTCFLTPRAMAKLEGKFRHELRPGSRVVSYAFRLPNVAADRIDKPFPRSTPVFVYTAPFQSSRSRT